MQRVLPLRKGASFHMHKASGLVRDAFRTRNMRDLPGNWGIAHVRYPTAGSASAAAEAQPFYVNSPFGLMLAHNGNLTNSEELKREMFLSDLRHINTNSDSEVLLNVLGPRVASGRQELPPGRGNRVYRGCRRASPLSRCLRHGGNDLRHRSAGVPRSLRHPAAGDRPQRHGQTAPSGWWRPKAWRWTSWASSWSVMWRPVRRSSLIRKGVSIAVSAPATRCTRPACSSLSISPVRFAD
jgi:hypothetical protein